MSYLNEAILKLFPVKDDESRRECEIFCKSKAYSVHELYCGSERIYCFTDNTGVLFVKGQMNPVPIYGVRLVFNNDPPPALKL